MGTVETIEQFTARVAEMGVDTYVSNPWCGTCGSLELGHVCQGTQDTHDHVYVDRVSEGCPAEPEKDGWVEATEYKGYVITEYSSGLSFTGCDGTERWTTTFFAKRNGERDIWADTLRGLKSKISRAAKR